MTNPNIAILVNDPDIPRYYLDRLESEEEIILLEAASINEQGKDELQFKVLTRDAKEAIGTINEAKEIAKLDYATHDDLVACVQSCM